MKAVIQRVSQADVKVGDEITDSIGSGLMVLLGIGHNDTESDFKGFGRLGTSIFLNQYNQISMV